ASRVAKPGAVETTLVETEAWAMATGAAPAARERTATDARVRMIMGVPQRTNVSPGTLATPTARGKRQSYYRRVIFGRRIALSRRRRGCTGSGRRPCSGRRPDHASAGRRWDRETSPCAA